MLTEKLLQQMRNDGMDEAVDEVTRLIMCEKRLLAITEWLDFNQPDVFARGIWDAINNA